MKQLLLAFNLLLLATLPNNLFCADADEPAPKRLRVESSFTFEIDYFTKTERRKAN